MKVVGELGFLQRIKRNLKNDPFATSESYIKWLRKKGVRVGEETTIFTPKSVLIDVQNPYMLSIGNYVKITAGVQILTHDYSLSVLCSVCGDVVGSVEKTTIGDNVFIGRNAIILKGVTIGDNVIIGAGSVVSRDCESNSVYAGVPAKRICSVEELYKKRKSKQKENAKELAITYYECTGKIPDESVLREYQMLYTDYTNSPDPPIMLDAIMRKSGYYEKCLNYYKTTKAEFDGIESFLEWCGIKK